MIRGRGATELNTQSAYNEIELLTKTAGTSRLHSTGSTEKEDQHN